MIGLWQLMHLNKKLVILIPILKLINLIYNKQKKANKINIKTRIIIIISIYKKVWMIMKKKINGCLKHLVKSNRILDINRKLKNKK